MSEIPKMPDGRSILQLPVIGGGMDDFNKLIISERLPFETSAIVSSLGYGQQDLLKSLEPESPLITEILKDLVLNVDHPELLRPDTRALMARGMPDGFIDHTPRLTGHDNSEAYASFEVMYWSMQHFYEAVRRRRTELHENFSAGEDASEKWVEAVEHHRSSSITRLLWRPIVKRFHPEWLESPDQYCYMAHIKKTHRGTRRLIELLEERQMRSRIVAAAVLSDTLVTQAYEEATTVGFTGISKKGTDFLRTMLSEEHPELSEHFLSPKQN